MASPSSRERAYGIVQRIAVIFAMLLAGNTFGQSLPAPAANTFRVRLTLDGKPFRGLVFVQTKNASGRLFCPEEGGVIPQGEGVFKLPLEGPVELTCVNSPGEAEAYAGKRHSDTGQGEVVVALKEVPWAPVTLLLADERGQPIAEQRVKVLQTIDGKQAWETDVITDKNGKAVKKCVAGAVYHLAYYRPKVAGAVISKDFGPEGLPKGEFAMVIPSMESVAFRFRLVTRTKEGVKLLVEMTGCEVVGAGGVGATDNVCYVMPSRYTKKVVEGATLHLRLPNDLGARYDFADGKGLWVVGKPGELADIELIPRVRYQLMVEAADADGNLLPESWVILRPAGNVSWTGSERGLFQELVAGKYEVRAWAEGYQLSANRTVDAAAGKLTLTLAAGAKADFVVHDADGKRIAESGITIYYASKEHGPKLQRCRSDKDGCASVIYDDTQRPVAGVYAKGYGAKLVALSKDTKSYDVTLGPAQTTRVRLVAGAVEKLPAGVVLQNVVWVSSAPARLRMGRTTLADGVGEVSLSPGEYTPAFEYSDMRSAPPGEMHNVVVCKPVKITGAGDAVELSPVNVEKVGNVIDGPQ